MLIVLMGVPGSGKTTYAHHLRDTIGARVVSVDDFRPAPGEGDGEAFRLAGAQVADLLLDRHDVVFDATHLGVSRHIARREGKAVGVSVELHVVTSDKADARNAARPAPVPDQMMRDMHVAFQDALRAAQSESWTAVRLVVTDTDPATVISL